jgi:DMSO/TMAO reductase YedYZ molybdopterin-dependent catalytic subunit
VAEPFSVPLAVLAALPRRELTADFHCVAGWSATGLRWEGVAFETFYRRVIEPSLQPGASITHVVFGGLDGFQSVLLLEDALDDDVLIAEQLDGRPLDGDHGAPARLVSPRQYGYVNVKHLCQIELHSGEPTEELGAPTPLARLTLRGPLIMRHPRARVWKEERHPYLPAWSLRGLYRLLSHPFRWLSARGGERE